MQMIRAYSCWWKSVFGVWFWDFSWPNKCDTKPCRCLEIRLAITTHFLTCSAEESAVDSEGLWQISQNLTALFHYLISTFMKKIHKINKQKKTQRQQQKSRVTLTGLTVPSLWGDRKWGCWRHSFVCFLSVCHCYALKLFAKLIWMYHCMFKGPLCHILKKLLAWNRIESTHVCFQLFKDT